MCVARAAESDDSHAVDGASNPRVVVLFPGALGDLVLAVPAIAGIRARHARARTTLAVAEWLRPLAATSGVPHETASLDDADAVGLFGGSRRPTWFGERPILYAWVGTRDPDVAARLRALAAEAELFAIPRGEGSEHAGSVYRRQVGLTAQDAAFRWPVVEAVPRVEALLHAVPRPRLAVHAGAGSAAKRWAAAGFDAVARRWREAGGGVIDVAGPAERGLAPLAGAHRVDAWSLVDVAALLARVDAYVGNDSGITHLAAAMGAPGVALFGPTDARRWAPRGASIDALTAATWAPDGIPAAALTPAAVWRALARRGCLDKLQGRT